MKPLFEYDTDHPPCDKCGFPCSPRSDGAMACINRRCENGKVFLDERKAADDPVTLVQCDKAMVALRALRYFPSRDDIDTAICDFLADLLHVCDLYALDFDDIACTARGHHEAERDHDEAAVEAEFIGMTMAELKASAFAATFGLKTAKPGTVSCAKCGSSVKKTRAFEDEGEGPEAGRTFYYCSEHCRETH